MIDKWAGDAREAGGNAMESVRNPQIFYDESQVIIRMASMCFIYGDITGIITEDISQVGLFKYLVGGNSR